jgi:ribosomal protein L29
MKKSVWELKQTHLLRALKRYIARIKTIARENDFNIG